MKRLFALLGAFASAVALADDGTVVSESSATDLALDLRADEVRVIASTDEILPLAKFGAALELSVRPMGSARADDLASWSPIGDWTVLTEEPGDGTVVWNPTEGRLYEVRLVADGETQSAFFNARGAAGVTRLTDLATLGASLAESSVVATGFAMLPAAAVRDGDTTLAEGVDYTVSGQNNVNVGQARVLFLGIGAYEGGVELPFSIVANPGAEVAQAAVSPLAVDLRPGAVHVILTTNELLATSVYTSDAVTLAVTPATATDNADVSTWSAAGAAETIGEYDAEQALWWCPTRRGLYILTLSGASGELARGYLDCTETAEFASAKPIDELEATLSADTFPCDGYAHRPTVRVVDGDGNELVEGRDFSVTYSSNVASGTATVTVKGIGDYLGTLTRTFVITPVEPSVGASATAAPVAADTRTNAVLQVAWIGRDTAFTRNNVADWPAGGLVSDSVKARLSVAEVTAVGEEPDDSAYRVFAERDGEGTSGWHPGKRGLFRVRLQIGEDGVYGAESGSRYLNFREFGGLMLLVK